MGYIAWREGAYKQKDATTTQIQETAETFRALAVFLKEEAAQYEAKGAECLTAWEATNTAVDTDKCTAMRAQEAIIATY